MPNCDGCPANCLARSNPGEFSMLCELWASGDPVHRAHVVARSNMGVRPAPETSPLIIDERPSPTARPVGEASSATDQAVPREAWPRAIAMASWLARPEDQGIGDTIARVVGPIGGDAFKYWWRKLFGSDCGCGTRQDLLNATYPYA